MKLEDRIKNIDFPRQAMSVKQAFEVVGGLSKTSKMPCYSWGLPAKDCKIGMKIASLEESTCYSCYARKGNYLWDKVQEANQRRLNKADHPRWVEAMIVLINWQARKYCQPYFRWFDTGDLQSLKMLDDINQVATNTPKVNHWLPTREHQIVKDYLHGGNSVAGNLTLRISAYFIDTPPPEIEGLPTSTVFNKKEPLGYECPAYEEKPATCYTCRECWNPQTSNVSYPLH